MWVLTRVAALISTAPVVSSRSVPMRVKLGLSLSLSLLIMPLIPPVPSVEPLSGAAVLITLQQILIGSAMGLILQFVFSMFVIGGQIIAFQMGLGFSQMVDPGSGTQVPVLSQLYVIVVTLLFFALDGHLAMIKTLTQSFSSLPIAVSGLTTDAMWQMILWSGQMYAAGVQIALPAIAAILLVNFTFAVVTRSAPQFNIFSIGFPITMIMGFLIIMLTLKTVLPQFTQQLFNAYELIRVVLSGG